MRVTYDKIPGWMPGAEIAVIEALCKEHKPRQIVEIGSFLGRSAVAWATFAPEAIIWCVDPFEGSIIESFSSTDIEHLYPQPNKQEQIAPIYTLFLENTFEYLNIRHIRCKSCDLIKFMPVPKADLVFIDGDHSNDGILIDLIVANHITKYSGIICGHDYNNPHLPVVTDVVNTWAADKGYLVKEYENTYMFELKHAKLPI